ncbi:MAG: HDIG domain-containing metalloprotein, partial [Dehalococcoidales bacterium]
MAPERRSAAGNGAAVMEVISDVLDAGATRLLAAVSDGLGGSRAYLVGGFVRDGLLGRRTTDVDIAVPDGMASARSLADRLGGHFVPLDAVNGVGRVIVEAAEFGEGRWQLDFSTAEGGIEQDLARRDFTMNAIAVDLEQLAAPGRRVDLIDPFDGRGDLARGLVRAVSDGVFESDPIRLLRAVRFAAELGLGIDDATDKLIRAGAGLVVGVAGERIREELLRLLAVAGSGRYLARLDELGLLTALIPELEAARGFEQPKEHQWDVLGHSLKTAEACDFLLRQGDWEYATGGVLDAVPWSPRLEEHFRRKISGASPGGSSASALLRLAAVLHDIAKPETRTVDADGRTRFLGHPSAGAAMAVAIVERLRFS